MPASFPPVTRRAAARSLWPSRKRVPARCWPECLACGRRRAHSWRSATRAWPTTSIPSTSTGSTPDDASWCGPTIFFISPACRTLRGPPFTRWEKWVAQRRRRGGSTPSASSWDGAEATYNNRQSYAIFPPPKGSLEAFMAATGGGIAFADFTAARRDRRPLMDVQSVARARLGHAGHHDHAQLDLRRCPLHRRGDAAALPLRRPAAHRP